MRPVILALAVLALAAPAAATLAQQPKTPAGQCFRTRDWAGWRAPDTSKIYIRLGLHQIDQVDFASPCTGITDPLARVVNQSTTGTVCSPLDLDIHVVNTGGFRNTCVASKITPLSAAEVAALPKRMIP